MHQIFDIQLNSDSFKDYSVRIPEESVKKTLILSNLSQINLFIGPNNCGKSRFLRSIASQELVFKSNPDFSELEKMRKELIKSLNDILPSSVDLNDIKKTANGLTVIDFIKEKDEFFSPLLKIIEKMVAIQINGLKMENAHSINLEQCVIRIHELGKALLENFQKITTKLPKALAFKKYYIPTLRSLRFFKEKDAFYEASAVYFARDPRPEIFTGWNLRDQIEDMRMGDRKERRALEDFEAYLSKSFFSGEDVELIPKKGNPLFIKIGKEEDFPIYNLGDGIQMIIIMTFLLFRFKHEPKLIFIEEPELFLHPGMQRIILEQFSASKNTQFFIATHSNHLLDMTIDNDNISVFNISKNLIVGEEISHAQFTIENLSRVDRKTLELLGVRNSSVFLSNCTIWVEGITDRRYLSHFLKLYGLDLKSIFIPKEDLHFSFVEYSGSNITHWSFLDNQDDNINVDVLCGKLFLIADKDSEKGKKKERLEKLKITLKDRFYCLECREIENLLSKKTIENILTQDSKGCKLNSFEYENYKDQPLGEFIDKTIFKEKCEKKYAAESGSIKNKVHFCELACENITTFDDLTDEAKKLTKRIYDFIKLHNTDKV